MSILSMQRADEVRNQILNCLAYDSCDSVVDSPPGAGKTYLVEDASGLVALHLEQQVIIACPSNSQADDVAKRIAQAFPMLRVTRFTTSDYQEPDDFAAIPNLFCTSDKRRLNSLVIVATVAKYIEVEGLGFDPDFLFVDEAYQVKKSDYDRIRDLAGRTMLVGDPGQIDPIVRTSRRLYAADRMGPHVPAPQALLAGGLARYFQLPVSRRLMQDSVDIVLPTFYAHLAFDGMVAAGGRSIISRHRPATTTDRLINDCLGRGSLSMITMPAALTPRTDRGMVALAAGICDRLVTNGYRYADDNDNGILLPKHIGIVVSHREQVTAVRKALGPQMCDIHVETANRFQGLERRLIIAFHPMSGKIRPDAFALDPGRLCVALSRHRIACMILGRDGIGEAIDRYVPDDDRFLCQYDDPVHKGWRAHQMLLAEMARRDRVVRCPT